MTKNSSNSLYGNTSRFKTGKIELDLRVEIERTLHGASDEIAKGRSGFLRKIRRDSEGKPVRCPCRDSITDEPDKDYFCKFCHSMGWFWDEHKIVYYKGDDVFRPSGNKQQETQPKKVDASYFYIECNEVITPIDIIVEVEVDKEGKITYPVKRLNFFEIWRPEDFKADNGRLEYWRVTAGLLRDWSVWYGRTNIRQIY
ncbi:MAG: hypothetical protein DRI24_11905 [Deltaproteobacteria bacterium]|nr:MAG: hypothetical protein DRI24_11905 [Deltaproteobacteria bacterium]